MPNNAVRLHGTCPFSNKCSAILCMHTQHIAHLHRAEQAIAGQSGDRWGAATCHLHHLLDKIDSMGQSFTS